MNRKMLACAVLITIGLLLGNAMSSYAWTRAPFHPAGHGHVAFRGGVFVGVPLWWGPGPWWWGGPGWWGPPYPAYTAPPVVLQPQSPVYGEPQSQQTQYWYFCQNPQGYYPYVQQCPSGWMTVVPQTPPSPGPPSPR